MPDQPHNLEEKETARSVEVPIRKRGGFTLLEMMISVALFATLAVMSASLLVKSTRLCLESLVRSDVMESAKVAQERVFDQLFSAKVMSLRSSGSQPSLTVVVPVELPLNGGPVVDYLNANGEINWGATEPTGPALDRTVDPHRLNITVIPSGQITEAECKLDINGDGDLLDRFEVGSLAMQTTDGPELLFVVGRLIFAETGKGAFDMDGDGAPDPLFQISGEAFTDGNANGVYDEGENFIDTNKNQRWDGILSINLLALSRDRDGQGCRFVYKTGVKLGSN